MNFAIRSQLMQMRDRREVCCNLFLNQHSALTARISTAGSTPFTTRGPPWKFGMSDGVHSRWAALLEWLQQKGMETSNILVEIRRAPGESEFHKT